MFKSNFDSVALTGIGLFAKESSLEEALRMTPAPPTNKTANIIEDADHGFMCEQRGSFNPTASSLGWQLLMNEFTS